MINNREEIIHPGQSFQNRLNTRTHAHMHAHRYFVHIHLLLALTSHQTRRLMTSGLNRNTYTHSSTQTCTVHLPRGDVIPRFQNIQDTERPGTPAVTVRSSGRGPEAAKQECLCPMGEDDSPAEEK